MSTRHKNVNRVNIGNIIIFSCAFFSLISHSVADEYHYNNILIGDRASGMGGAYVSISDDPSGLFYNPAGIVHAVGSNISGSMNALHNTDTTYKKALGNAYDWKRTSTVLFPNFFGVFQPFAGGKLGFSYAVTDSIQEDQDQTFLNIPNTNVSKFIINFNNQDSTYNIGPSFAINVNDTLSIGTTLYAHVRTQERILNQLLYFQNNTDVEWNNTYYYTNETGFKPIFGAIWSPADKISLGFSIKKTIILSSTTEAQSTCFGASSETYAASSLCQNGTLNRSTFSSDAKRDLPMEISSGITYFHNDRWLFTGDLNYFSATAEGLTVAREAVMNFALGGEYYHTSEWAFRAGLYSNSANTPEISMSSANAQAEHVDLIGFSFSVSHFSRNSALTAGINLTSGSGEVQLFNQLGQVRDVDIFTNTLFLSATYSY